MTSFDKAVADSAIIPPALQPGDKIAILAPAGPVKWDKVKGASEVIRELGYEPVVYPTVHMKSGQVSGSPAQRFADVRKAFEDPEIKAILCARGGYGLVHIMDSLATLPIEDNPKWVVGFSDISAFHALLASKGVASIHGSMCHHIARGMEEPENVMLFQLLANRFPACSFEADYRNHPGHGEGRLLGGNLSVIQALIATPYDLIQPGSILFIEDVDEPIYKVERIMYQLRLSGILDRLSGIILGQFTGYKEDQNHTSMEQMLAEALSDYPDLPVAFNIPIGHIRHNTPLVVSADVSLDVRPDGVTLSYIGNFSPSVSDDSEFDTLSNICNE